jgi:ribose 5-phosphate isomerase A
MVEMDTSNAQKRAAAEAAVEQVRDGMVVGLGTGSTADLALDALGRRVGAGLKIVGIPTSERTAARARALNIALAATDGELRIDLAIDGADEVERSTLNLIKGNGGALLREKIVASASTRFVVIADESKLVDRLGSHFAVPVEVERFGWRAAARKLEKLGAAVAIRRHDGKEFVSDGSNYILDCSFGLIADPPALARELDAIVGVVEHGLFVGMTSEVLIGSSGGVTVLGPILFG